jgi:anti-sigma factor RsiW
MSDCTAIRQQLLDSIRGRLSEAEQARVAEHAQTCASCRHILELERALDQALAQRPKYALPDSLHAKLAAPLTPKKPKSHGLGRARLAAIAAPGLAAALLFGFALRGWLSPNSLLVTEAVNDHLRVVYAEHPIEIESGGIHQVKPWFTGRLDFAPPLSFSGDEEFPLVGGAIGLFVDRKAATFVFKHRLHTISLFVFRGDSLPFPLRADTQVASRPASSATSRGFNVLLWRDGDLGYALVSDVDPTALARLAAKVAPQ